jgi:hypothetical protein
MSCKSLAVGVLALPALTVVAFAQYRRRALRDRLLEVGAPRRGRALAPPD